MTFAEYLIGRSGLPSGTATLMEHLEAIQGEGGTVIIGSDVIRIEEIDSVILQEIDTHITIDAVNDDIIKIDDTGISILIDEEGEILGLDTERFR